MSRTILRRRFLEHVAQTSPSPLAIEVDRAEGVFLYGPGPNSADDPALGPPDDAHPEGRRWFDLVSGVSVSNVGHGCSAVVEAVQKQAAAYMHTMVYGEMVLSPQVEYARRLTELLPPELQSVYFVNSGAEAVEGALKLAKRATDRRKIIAFRRAYHGSTHGALSLMSSPEGDEWRTPFEPLLPDVDHLTFNDFEGLSLITDRVACVVVEPVQGEAGVRLPEAGFLQALRARCSETGALLIFDEIQTGMGRTWRRADATPTPATSNDNRPINATPHHPSGLFAFERYGVVPDILCLAKAFGGGMPLGAFISSTQTMGLLSHDPALGHITTFGGHPVCCAAGLAALEYILSENLPNLVDEKGALFETLLCDHPAVKEIRRAGLLAAVELGDSAKLMRLMELFKSAGIVSDWFLFCDTAFRISPPLTITEGEIRECCTVIRRCLDTL